MSSIIPIIGREALGLLPFLDLKTGGERPSQLAQYVQPILDMETFYAEGSTQFGAGTTANMGVGYNALTGAAGSPAPGTMWWVRRIWAFSNATVADTATWGVGWSRNASSVVLVAANAEPMNGGIVGGAIMSLAATWEGNLLLRDEGEICVNCYTTTGVSTPAFVRWEFLVLPL